MRREQGHLHVCGALSSFVSGQRTAARRKPRCPHQGNDPDSNPRHLVTRHTERQQCTEQVHFVMTAECNCGMTGLHGQDQRTPSDTIRLPKMQLNVIVPRRFIPLLPLCKSFAHQNYVQFLCLPQTSYISSPSKPPRFHYPNKLVICTGHKLPLV